MNSMLAYRLDGLENPLDVHGSAWSFVEVLKDTAQRSETLHASGGVGQCHSAVQPMGNELPTCIEIRRSLKNIKK